MILLRTSNDDSTTHTNHEEMEMARKKRFNKDSDIITANEWEIATEDKVMLLVTRMLNDRMSLPGFVYRSLINEHKNRSTEEWRKQQQQQEITTNEQQQQQQQHSKNNDNDIEQIINSNSTSSSSTLDFRQQQQQQQLQQPSRTKRQDSHAVIKHVTVTLLEVRPGFAASPRITEMSATAVERLVFGELYDSIFDEIVTETRPMDEALQIKITQFDSQQQRQHRHDTKQDTQNQQRITTPTTTSTSDLYYEYLSDNALDALRKLPESHTAVEKLSFCVQFLERISVHFSDDNNNNEHKKKRSSVMGADALLKMVCQHIIAAKIPNLNAEIAFVEEFARDEQLLRGKEGYTLVTLQASLNFLNTSDDFDRDIFYPNEE